jgi:hypothetical protein
MTHACPALVQQLPVPGEGLPLAPGQIPITNPQRDTMRNLTGILAAVSLLASPVLLAQSSGPVRVDAGSPPSASSGTSFKGTDSPGSEANKATSTTPGTSFKGTDSPSSEAGKTTSPTTKTSFQDTYSGANTDGGTRSKK